VRHVHSDPVVGERQGKGKERVDDILGDAVVKVPLQDE
jgi:hypothetical protein